MYKKTAKPTMVSGETATLSTLREDNKLLTLKIKYLQSVTTIYRQKIAAITRQTLRHLSDQIDVDARVDGAIEAAELDTEAALRQFDAATATSQSSPRGGPAYGAKALLYGSPTSSPRGLTPASLSTPEEEAAFWRSQFLNVVAEMRPVSVHDAQVLCNALSDKKQLQDEVNALKRGSELVVSPSPPGVEDSASPLRSEPHQPSISMVLVSPLGGRGGERFGDGVTIRDSTTGASYPDTSPQNMDMMRKKLSEEQNKNRALRVRIESLGTQLGESESDLRSHISTLRSENVRVIRSMRDLEADRARLIDDNHELNQQVLLHKQTVAMKESQISRLEGRTKALERELQSASNRMDALFEEEHERRTAETAALQKAFDDNRQLQNEIQLLKANLLSAERQQVDSDIEYQKLATAVSTLKNIQVQLRHQVETAARDKHASSLEHESLKNLLPRMGAAQDDLEKFFTFREVSAKCGHLNKQMDDLQSVCKSMLELNKYIEMRHKEIRLLRAECERSTSIGLPPSIAQNVDTVLVDPEFVPVPELKPRKHVVLRQEGTWLELRDTGSGRTSYITSSVSETPFCPIKIKSAEEAKKKAEEEARLKAAEEEAKTASDVAPNIGDVDEAANPPAEDSKTSPPQSRKKREVTAPIDPGMRDRLIRIYEEAKAAEEEAKAAGEAANPPPQSRKKRDPTAPIDPSVRDRLIRIYHKYNPEKLATVDLVMDRFRGRYDAMLAKLVQKYGPEPDPSTPLPTLPAQVTEAPSEGTASGASSVAGHADKEASFAHQHDSPHDSPESPTNEPQRSITTPPTAPAHTLNPPPQEAALQGGGCPEWIGQLLPATTRRGQPPLSSGIPPKASND